MLVVHFTRREAIRQIEVLQHVATNLGRSEYYQAGAGEDPLPPSLQVALGSGVALGVALGD